MSQFVSVEWSKRAGRTYATGLLELLVLRLEGHHLILKIQQLGLLVPIP